MLCSRWQNKIRIPAKPFDYDDKLDIAPEEYHALKETIGEMMLNRFLRA